MIPMESTLSLIVPVFNEEESIAPFLEAIDRHLAELPAILEILFIDDGSSDRTIAEIKRAQRVDPRVRYIKLSRNFGKEAAMTAGLDHASGDAVIPMDVDLQDPPELIHEFFRLWQEGYDTVYACAGREMKIRQVSVLQQVYFIASLIGFPIPKSRPMREIIG